MFACGAVARESTATFVFMNYSSSRSSSYIDAYIKLCFDVHNIHIQTLMVLSLTGCLSSAKSQHRKTIGHLPLAANQHCISTLAQVVLSLAESLFLTMSVRQMVGRSAMSFKVASKASR